LGGKMNIDLKFWDRFYTEMERGMPNNKRFVRPVDWKERAIKAESKRHNPVGKCKEGRTYGGNDHE
jgi:hypothetical protein